MTERGRGAARDGSGLLARFPALAALPRASLGRFPSPVERLDAAGSLPPLWLKRDDLNTDPPYPGGNKVRALEFLLGPVAPGDTVITLGARARRTCSRPRSTPSDSAPARWRCAGRTT